MNCRLTILAILSLVVGISYIADAAAEPTGAVDDYAGTTNSRFVTIIDVLGNDVSGAVITDVTQPTTPKGSSPVLGVSYGTVSHNGTHVTWTPDLRASVDLQWPTSVAHNLYRLPIHFNYTITAGGTTDTARVILNLTADRLDPSSDIATHEPAYSPEARPDRFVIDLAPTSLDVLANDAVHPTGAESGALSITDVTHVRVRESRITVLEDGRTSYAPIFEPEHTGTVSISNNGTRIVYTPGTNVTHRPTAYTALFEYTVTDGRYIGKAIVELHVDDQTLVNDRINPTVIDILDYHNATGLTVSSAGPVTSVDPDRVGTISHNTTHVTFTPGQNINDLPYPVPNHAEFVLEYGLSDGQTGTATIILYDGSDFAVFGDTIRSKYRNGSHVHTLDVLSNDILPGGATITSVSELRLENPHLTQAQMAQWLSQNTSHVCNDGFGTERCYELEIAGQRASLGSINITEDGRSITYTEAGPYSTDTFPNIEIPNLYTSTTVQYPLVFDYTVTAGSENLTGTVWLVSAAPLPGADGPIDAVDDTVNIEPSRADKYPSAKIFVLNNDEADGVAVTITEEPRHGSVLVRPDPIRINNCTIEVGQYVYDEDGNIEDFHLFNNTGKVSNDGGAGYDLNGATCEETDAPDYYPAILTYTADAYYSGTDSFEYTVTRGGIESDTATVNIDIAGLEHPVQIDESSIPREGVHTVPIRHNATDRVDPKHPNATATWGDFRNTHGYIPVARYNITYYDDRVVVGDLQGTYTFTVRATDRDGTPITFGLEGGEDNMRIDPNTGVFTWDPTNTQRGLHEFNVTASSGSDTARQTVRILVVAENHIWPSGPNDFDAGEFYAARDDAVRVPSGTATSIDVLANDVCGGDRGCTINPADATGLTITDFSMYDPVTHANTTLAILEEPSNGTARIVGGEISYMPNAGHSGTDTITYEIATSGPAYREVRGQLVQEPSEFTDADGPIVIPARISANATLTIAVLESGHPVNDDYITVPPGSENIIDVLANDATGTRITSISGLTGSGRIEPTDTTTFEHPTDGTITRPAPDTTITFHSPGLTGVDATTVRFSYNATYNGQTHTAWVRIVVTDTSAAASDTAYTRPNTGVLIDVLANDILPHGTPDIQSVTQPSNGTATIEGDRVFYDPQTNYTGVDTFAYTIPNGTGTLTANVTVIVSEPARANDDSGTAASGRPTIIDVLSNDDNTEGATVTLTKHVTVTSGGRTTTSFIGGDGNTYYRYGLTPVIETAPAPSGTVEVLPDNTIRYTSPDDYTGTDTFFYRIGQASGQVSDAQVTVNVTSIDDEAFTLQDDPVLIPVLDNDLLEDDADILLVHRPLYGQAAPQDNGTILYTPPAGYTGTDTFRYTASDGTTTTGTVEVTVTVAGPLVAPDITVSTPVNTTLKIQIIDDPDRVGLGSAVDPPNGSLEKTPGRNTVVENGTHLTYTPNDGFVGTDTFPYSLTRTSTGETTSTATVTITVGAADDTAETLEGQTINIPVRANDGVGIEWSLDDVSDPRNGLAELAGGANVSYTPNDGFIGTDTFIYNMSGSGGTPVVTPTVTVEVLRIAVDDTARVREDSATGINIYVLRNDNLGRTPDGDEAAGIVANATISEPQNGTARQTDPSNSFITYRPDPGFSGIDTFTYTLDHADTPRGNETSVTATVTVQVTPVTDQLDFEIPQSISEYFGALPIEGFDLGNIPVEQEYMFTANVTENVDNVPYRFELGAVDVDGSPIGMAIPDDATLTPEGVFAWTPTAEQTGTHLIGVNLVPLAGDLLPTSKIVNLCVADEPSISHIGDIETFVGEQVALNVTIDSSCPTGLPQFSLVTAPDGATLSPRESTITYEVGNDRLVDPEGNNRPQRVTAMLISSYASSFEWTPGPDDVATNHTVTIRAAGLDVADHTFTITVKPGNKAPQFTAPYRYYALEAGENFYSVPFRDAKFLSDDAHELNPRLTYLISDDKPAGLDVNGQSGTIRWTPTANDTGRHEFNFTVSDGQYEDTMRVIIMVLPQLSASDDTVETAPDSPVVIRPLDNDGSNGTIIVNYTSPANGTIRIFDKTFLYTPNSGFDGTDIFDYTIQYQFGANTQNVTATVSVTVSNTTTNRAPTITAIGDQTISEGSLLEFNVTASDPNGDDFEYVLFAAPHNAALNASSGAFAWTPTEVQDGPHVITIGAVDNGSAAAVIDVNVAVSEVNVPTTGFHVDNATVELGMLLEHPVRATDPDQTRVVTEGRSKIVPQITFGLAGEPDGMEINSVTQNGDLNTANIEWTPNATGASTFNVTVTDGNTALSREITITVADTTPPVITLNGPEILEIMINGPYMDPSANVTDNDPAYNGTVAATPATIDTSVAANHTVTYSAPADAAGNVPESVNRTVRIIEIITNRPPVAPSLANTTAEDTPITITPQISDPDEGDTPVITGVTDGMIGMADHDNTTITYVPRANEYGQDTITYVVTDDENAVATGTINITVTAVNDDPVLGSELRDLRINAERSHNVTVTAGDVDGDPLTFGLAGAPENATIGRTSGFFEWTPSEPRQLGNHAFTVTVSDGQGGFDSRNITLQVFNSTSVVNNPPQLNPIGNRSIVAGQTLEIRPNATDPENDPLTYELTRRTLPAAATFNTSSGYLDWTPAESDAGTYIITITVHDDQGTSDSENITITVTEPPTVHAPDITIRTTPYTPVAIRPSIDPSLTITSVTNATGGDVNLIALPDGIIIYTANRIGTDMINYTVSDINNVTDTGIIRIFINEEGNLPPRLSTIDDMGVRVGENLNFTAAAVDDEGDPLTFGLANGPEGATINATTGYFSWTPAASQNGSYVVTVIVHDGRAVDWQHITITVLSKEAINQNPVPENITTTVVLGGGKGFQPVATDPDGDKTSIIRFYNSSLGDVDRSFTSQGIIVYIAGVLGDDEVIYTVSDGRGGFANGTISITVVEPTNVRPIFDFIGDKSINANNTLTFTATARDIDGNVTRFDLVGAPENASMTAQGVFSWTPTGDDVGRYEFAVIVFDDAGENSTESITVTVRPIDYVNSPPAAPDVVIMTPQDVLSISRPTLTDPDEGDPVLISETGNTAKGRILSGFLRAGIIIYLPNQGESGVETVNYTASDSSNGTDTATITAFISARGNVNPILGSIDFRNINAGQQLEFDLEAEDPDGDVISYMLVGAPDGTEISPEGTFRWTPAAADVRNHTFTVIAYDDRGGADSKTAVIRVLPAGTVNQPPTAQSFAITVDPRDSIVITPEISDPDGDLISITDAVVDGTGIVIPLPDSMNYVHISTVPTETINYTVTDIRGASSTGTITISISGHDGGLTERLQIGLLLPLTGVIASHGEENAAASRIAAADFNEHLTEQGAGWQIELVEEDTASNATISRQKIQSLDENGTKLVIGPAASGNVLGVKNYSDANDMLVVSCCSTAQSLAIAGDSIYRLVPDDGLQAVALSQIMSRDNITALVPIWRGDTWGDGLESRTVELFTSDGSKTYDQGIRYDPGDTNFTEAASSLAQKVQVYVDARGADHVGVFYIGFSEVVQLMQAASAHDILDDIRWYGSDANANEPSIVEDDIASSFAQNVTFTAVQAAPSDNPTARNVTARVQAEIGRLPGAYIHGSYDAVWLVGLSIIETGGTDAGPIKSIFADVAQNYTGALGDIMLNEAGDLVQSEYHVWQVDSNGTWNELDTPIDLGNPVAPNRPPMAPNATATVAVNSSVTITPGISDPDGDQVNITGVAGATMGVAMAQGDTIQYSSTSGEPGIETITYTVEDSRGATSAGTITINITRPDDGGLTNRLQIGLLLPFTGDLASHGEETAAASRLAAADFNEHLTGQNASWQIELVEEDTASNATISRQKIQSLDESGIKLVIGPAASISIQGAKNYSDSNDMLMVSCCSAAQSLAIAGDSVYRLVPDDGFQAVALSQIMSRDNITALVPVWRGDIWGDGLTNRTAELFISDSSREYEEGIRYDPGDANFTEMASTLAQKVQGYVDLHGAQNVGVLYIGFSELVLLMQNASTHDILDDVRWYGSTANANEPSIVRDDTASAFAQNVTFTAVQAAPSDNPTSRDVVERVQQVTDRLPSVYVHGSYDAVWLVGLSIMETGGTDAGPIKNVFADVAQNYTGALGDIMLNEAGDLVPRDYDVWRVADNGTWTKLDTPVDVSNPVAPNRPPMAPNVTITMAANSSTTITPGISDPDGDPVNITGVTGATVGIALWQGDTIQYTSTSSESGNETLTYIVTDAMGANTTGTVTIRIEADDSGLTGRMQVGLLMPLTGVIASHGEENAAASKLAAADFNEHLRQQNASWQIELIEEDTASNATITLQKIRSLDENGTKLVIGPAASSNIQSVKNYSDSNDMLIVSCCSTAQSLAIAGDSIYRLVPDDGLQAVALSQIMSRDNITALVPIWRGDTWGDGLENRTVELFTSDNSNVYDEGIRYDPADANFTEIASMLAQKVQQYVNSSRGAENVGVFYIGFSEVVHLMKNASTHDILNDIRWYGSDANANEPSIVEDDTASAFAQNVTFTAVQAAPSDNPTAQNVTARVQAEIERLPGAYVHGSYDAVWLVGLSIMETGGTNASQIKNIFADVAQNYTGALGDIMLNEAGDLVQSEYHVWQVDSNGTWNELDTPIDVGTGN